MLSPPTPIDEIRRLRSLTALGILDTIPEERFDRITRLACRAFNVPIALVSLVDRDRQWFKSKQGLNACETSRNVSFCGHAIVSEGPLVVPDALLDPRFADNPLVTGFPNVRFYAGQPVHGTDGSRIGTLCVIDRQPRELKPEDYDLLADLAAMIDREFALVENASTDEMTGLSNRRGFTAIANHVLALCRRTRQPAAVIGIDLDNFKVVNDRFGHEAGDDVLRLFAQLLQAQFRSSDVVARIGGDEFVVLCSGTTSDLLPASLERLKGAFAASSLVQNHPGLGWSAGLADWDPASKDTIEDLLRISDGRMYAAKVASKASASGKPDASNDLLKRWSD
jgi:diguanylate cyclase (GGDEF)-like protein